MEKHTVPQNIMDVEFKLFGELTVRQFGYVAGGGFVALFFWFILKEFPLIQYFFVAVSAGLGIAMALLKVNNQPFEIWLGNYLKALFTSQKRVWRKENKPPEFLQQAEIEVKSYSKTEAQLKNIDMGDGKTQIDLSADFMPHPVGGTAKSAETPISTSIQPVLPSSQPVQPSQPVIPQNPTGDFVSTLGQRGEEPQTIAPVSQPQPATPMYPPSQTNQQPNPSFNQNNGYQQTQADPSSTVFSNQPLPPLPAINDPAAAGVNMYNDNIQATNTGLNPSMNVKDYLDTNTPTQPASQTFNDDKLHSYTVESNLDTDKDDFSVNLNEPAPSNSVSEPPAPVQADLVVPVSQGVENSTNDQPNDLPVLQTQNYQQPEVSTQSEDVDEVEEAVVQPEETIEQNPNLPSIQNLSVQEPAPVQATSIPEEILDAHSNVYFKPDSDVDTNTSSNNNTAVVDETNIPNVTQTSSPPAQQIEDEEIKKIKIENDELKNQINDYTSQVEELKSELNQSKGTFEELSNQNQEMEEKVESYSSQIETLKNELGESEHKYEEIINQNQNLLQQFELLKQQMTLLTQAQQTQQQPQPTVSQILPPVQTQDYVPQNQPVVAQPYNEPIYQPQQPIYEQPVQTPVEQPLQQMQYQQQPINAPQLTHEPTAPSPIVSTPGIDQTAAAQSFQTPTIYNGPSLSRKANVISGIVKDSTDKLLPGVIVIIKNDQNRPVRAMKTNTLGQFITTTALEDGPYSIELTKSNYIFDKYQVTLNGQIVSTFEFIAK